MAINTPNPSQPGSVGRSIRAIPNSSPPAAPTDVTMLRDASRRSLEELHTQNRDERDRDDEHRLVPRLASVRPADGDERNNEAEGHSHDARHKGAHRGNVDRKPFRQRS